MSSGVDYSDGGDVERLVEQLFRNRGWKTVPARTQRINQDGAPLLRNKHSGNHLIMPDAFAIGYGRSVWAEMKKKSDGPVFTRKRGQHEHGIEERQWDDYTNVAATSGTPVWIFVFEVPSGELLAGRVSELETLPPIDAAKTRRYYGEDMLFIPRGSFQQVRISNADVPESFSHTLTDSSGAGVSLNDVVLASTAGGPQR